MRKGMIELIAVNNKIEKFISSPTQKKTKTEAKGYCKAAE